MTAYHLFIGLVSCALIVSVIVAPAAYIITFLLALGFGFFLHFVIRSNQ